MMVTRSARRVLLLLAAMLSAPLGGARAQSVDYGALEQLFGEPITTSVTGKPQKASDVPANLVILTQDDIRRSGADNIPDILRYVTGLDVRSYGIVDANVGIRGYNQPSNPRLLVMVNGRQIYQDDYGDVAWNALPVQLDEIRQIEVVKGPNSALFGFNAASGVINIVTFDPIKDRVNAITVRTGNQSLAEGSVVGTAHLSDTAGVRVSAGGLRVRDFDPPGLDDADRAALPTPTYGAFNVQASWQVRPNLQVTAEGGAVDSASSLDIGTILAMRRRLNTARIGATADTGIGALAFDFYRNQSRNGALSTLGPTDVMNVVYVAKASDLLKLDADNTVRLGVEYRNNAATSPFFGGTIGYQVMSADAMWDWQITPTLSLVNAVRVDHLTLHLAGQPIAGTGLTAAQYDRSAFTEPSFNSGLVWQFTDDDTFRLTAARGLQVPSLVDYAFQVELPQIGPLVFGNPNLRPTVVWNYEAGYDRGVPLLDSTVRTAVFFQRNVDLLATSFLVPPGFQAVGPYSSQSSNIGSSHEIGAELGIKGKSASGLRWNASYSFASITDDLGPGLEAPALQFRRGTPQHTVILGGGYSVGRWELDAQSRWQSSYQDFRPSGYRDYIGVKVANYLSFSARVGFRLTDNITLSGTAEQFNVSRFVQTAGPEIQRRFIAAATARF